MLWQWLRQKRVGQRWYGAVVSLLQTSQSTHIWRDSTFHIVLLNRRSGSMNDGIAYVGPFVVRQHSCSLTQGGFRHCGVEDRSWLIRSLKRVESTKSMPEQRKRNNDNTLISRRNGSSLLFVILILV